MSPIESRRSLACLETEAGSARHVRRKARARAILDFEAAGAVPEEALRQAAPSAITLKAALARAPTLLPEDLHYEASVHADSALAYTRSA